VGRVRTALAARRPFCPGLRLARRPSVSFDLTGSGPVTRAACRPGRERYPRRPCLQARGGSAAASSARWPCTCLRSVGRSTRLPLTSTRRSGLPNAETAARWTTSEPVLLLREVGSPRRGASPHHSPSGRHRQTRRSRRAVYRAKPPGHAMRRSCLQAVSVPVAVACGSIGVRLRPIVGQRVSD
jgi:hypothetical protein